MHNFMGKKKSTGTGIASEASLSEVSLTGGKKNHFHFTKDTRGEKKKKVVCNAVAK